MCVSACFIHKKFHFYFILPLRQRLIFVLVLGGLNRRLGPVTLLHVSVRSPAGTAGPRGSRFGVPAFKVAALGGFPNFFGDVKTLDASADLAECMRPRARLQVVSALHQGNSNVGKSPLPDSKSPFVVTRVHLGLTGLWQKRPGCPRIFGFGPGVRHTGSRGVRTVPFLPLAGAMRRVKGFVHTSPPSHLTPLLYPSGP